LNLEAVLLNRQKVYHPKMMDVNSSSIIGRSGEFSSIEGASCNLPGMSEKERKSWNEEDDAGLRSGRLL
jgi:hypothetical protein